MSRQTQVALATTTFYRSENEVRAQCALRLIHEAIQEGYKVVVVDGGSPSQFCETMTREGAAVHQQSRPTMGAGRRQAISLALQTENSVVVWIEPEKYPLVCDLNLVLRPIREEQADIVIPKRRSLDSYPTSQQLAEKFGNVFFNQLLGFHVLDPWFGPRAMNWVAARCFLDYTGTYGDMWDSIFIPLVRAKAIGLRFASVDVNYVHPPEQTAEEESAAMTLKRFMQLRNLIPALQAEAERLGLLS